MAKRLHVEAVYSEEELKRIQKFSKDRHINRVVGGIMFVGFALIGVIDAIYNGNYQPLVVFGGIGLAEAGLQEGVTYVQKIKLDSYRRKVAVENGGMFISRRPSRLAARVS